MDDSEAISLGLPTAAQKLATAKANMRNYMATIVEGMEFPEYVHQEYPKWVTPPGGQPLIVQDATEEMRVMQAAEPEKPAFTADELKAMLAQLEPPKPERAQLFDKATELGLSVPGNISTAKLRAAVADKEAEIADASGEDDA